MIGIRVDERSADVRLGESNPAQFEAVRRPMKRKARSQSRELSVIHGCSNVKHASKARGVRVKFLVGQDRHA